ERRAFAEQLLVLGRRLARKRQRRAHQRAQLLEADRLRHVVEGARLQRRDRVLGAAEGGDYRHRQVCAQARNVTHQLAGLAVGQPHVGEAELKATVLQPLLRLGDGRHARHPEAHLEQRQLEQLADVGLVVDHQRLVVARLLASLDPGHGLAGLLATTRKCAPETSRTCSSTARLAAHSSRARYRPRPVPKLSVVKNGSKSWPRLDGGTPGPLSVTLSSTRSPALRAEMRIAAGSARA